MGKNIKASFLMWRHLGLNTGRFDLARLVSQLQGGSQTQTGDGLVLIILYQNVKPGSYYPDGGHWVPKL